MKRKLLLLLCSVLTSVSMWAYTTADLTAAGWSEVTAISNDANNDNYVGKFVYVFVDAGSSSYVMSRNPNDINARPQYITLDNPITKPKFVWTIEHRSNGYALRNIESQYYFNGGTYGWDETNKMAATYDNNASFTFTSLSEGKYSLQRATGTASPGMYVGPWNDGGSVSSSGEEVATNKNDGQHPDFYVYKMAKATYLQKYLQQCPNLTAPVDVSYLIVNPTIYQANNNNTMPSGWSEYSVNSDYRTTDGANTNTKLKIYKSSRGSGDYYQTITSIPNGLYRLTAAVRDKNSTRNVKPYIMPTGGSEDSRKESANAAGGSLSDLTTDYLTLDAGSSNNSVNAGIHTNGHVGGSTVEADNFRMEINPYISTMATDLPANGAMTAGLWYSFSVDATGYYDLSGTTVLDDIIYVTGSTKPLSEAGSTTFTSDVLLTAGETYYMRSSSNNTFVYEGSKISSIADAYPAGGALTADKWYVYSIPMTGDYYFSATGGVVYTTNGNQSVFNPSTSAATAKVSFNKGDNLYVKSSTNQTVKIEGKFYLSTTVGGVTMWLNKDNDNITYVKDTGLEFIVTKDANDYYYFQYGDGYVADAGYSWITKISNDTNKQWVLEEVNGKYLVKLKADQTCRLVVINTETDLVELSRNDSRTDYVWSFVTPDGYASYKALDDVNDKITAVGTLPYADPDKKPSTYNASSPSDAATHAASLTTALRAYIESNAIAENVPGVNRTNLIKNAYGSNTDGWSGDFWTMSNEPYTQADGTTATSYFDKNSVKQFTTSQTIKLPKGNYILSVTARAQSGIDSYKMRVTNNAAETAEVNLSAIGNQDGIFGRGWNDFYVTFEQKAFGDATISVVGDNTTSNEDFWMSWGRFRLYSIDEEGAYEISEEETYTPVNGDVEGIKVSLTRTIKSDVINTLVLPFDMSQDEVESTFGTGSKVYVVDNYDAENEKVVFSQDDNGITANKPCLLMATSAGTEYNFTGRTLKAGTASDSGDNISMTGNYENSFTVPENNYIISGGSIYRVNSTITMKNTRAYITLTNPSSARVSIAYDDDDPTAINAIEAAEEGCVLEDGKYLIDGKIVIVKNGVKYSANGQKLN